MSFPLLPAQWFHASGVGVFPIKARDKVPACASWDDFVPKNDAQVSRFVNYGVRLGRGAALAVADSDSPEAEAWAAQYLPDTPFIVDTARGVHRYYRIVDTNAPHFFHRGDLTLEFRHLGQYVVGPGSIHASGVVYTARPWSWNIHDIPFFPTDTFVFDDRTGAMQGSQNGQPLVMPEQITAGERHDLMFKLLRSLQARGVGDDAAIAACHKENQVKCVPPIDARELERYLRRVSRHADRPNFTRIETVEDDVLIVGALIDAGVSVEATLAAVPHFDPNADTSMSDDTKDAPATSAQAPPSKPRADKKPKDKKPKVPKEPEKVSDAPMIEGEVTDLGIEVEDIEM